MDPVIQAAIDAIKGATSLQKIVNIVNVFSAQATGASGGVIYNGSIGTTSAEKIAVSLAEQNGLSVINSTPRAQFLATATDAIKFQASATLEAGGANAATTLSEAGNCLYGDAGAAANSFFSLGNSLGGQASHTFASSLSGDVVEVSAGVNPARIIGGVEVPALLENGVL